MKTQVFVQDKFLCIDIVMPDGRGQYSRENLEQVQKRYPGAYIADLDEWSAAKEIALCTEPEPITEERYMEMLEVLPPQRWHFGSKCGLPGCESFELSEHTSGRVTCVYVQTPEGYFAYQTVAGKTLAQHVEACRKAKVAA